MEKENGFTIFITEKLSPVATKLSQNDVIQAITRGMLGIISLTVGVSFVSILVNLPIAPWTDFLKNTGLMGPAKELIAACTSLQTLYIVVSIAVSYADIKKISAKACALLSLAVFIVLMPQSITVGDTTIGALKTDYLGSSGIFVAILVSLLVSSFYNYLMKKNIKWHTEQFWIFFPASACRTVSVWNRNCHSHSC